MPREPNKSTIGSPANKQKNDLLDASLLFQQVIENAQDGIIVYGADLRYKVWNPFMERLSGKSAAEVIGRHPLEIYPLLKEVGAIDALEKILVGGPPVTIEYRYQLPGTGKSGWVSDHCSPLHGQNGEVIGVIGIVRDITEGKITKDKLQERVKEIECLYTVSLLTSDLHKSIDEVLSAAVEQIPPGWQYPEITCARITFEGREFVTANFKTSDWRQSANIVISGETVGMIDVLYTEDRPSSFEGPFLKEERKLLDELALRIASWAKHKQAEISLIATNKRFEALWNITSLHDVTTKNINDHVLEAIVKMTDSPYGFYGFINDDESVMTISSWSGDAMKGCSMAEKPTDFPICDAGVWGEAVRQRGPFILNGYEAEHMAKKGLPEGHVPLTNLLVVPNFIGGKIMAVVAVANKASGYNERDVTQVEDFLKSIQVVTNVKRTEDALQESEERYRAIVDNALIGIGVAEEDKAVYMNKALIDIYGYDDFKELAEMPILELVTPETRHVVTDYRKKIESGESVSAILEHDIVRKDGRIRTLQFMPNYVFIGGNRYAYTTFIDITERKLAEQELQRNLESLNESQRIGQLGSYDIDFISGLWTSTETLDKIFGIGDSYQRTVEGWLAIVHPDWKEIMLKYLSEDVLTLGISFDKEYKIKRMSDGGERWVHGFGRLDKNSEGRPVKMMGTIQDITERKHAEELLQAAIDRYAAILKSIPDLLFEVDLDGVTYDYHSPAYEDLYVPPEVFLGKSMKDVLPKDATEVIMNALQAADQSDLPCKAIYSLDMGGVRKWFEIAVVKKGSSPSQKRFLIIARNITDRIKMEQERETLQAQLYQAQKMEAVGHFAGGMAHDFNNMLGVILGAVELAKFEISEDSPAQKEMRTILEAVMRARELSLKLLTFSRKEKINVKGVEAKNILDDLKEMLGRTIPKSIDLNVIVKDKSIIICDLNQIQQALINICNNAVDSMPTGGKLTLEAGEEYFPNGLCQECGQNIGGRYCLIQITDTGEGIAPETLPRITEPFFTTKALGKGTGLGLSVTRGIILSHNGHMHFHSEPDKGTCVKIYLPIAESTAMHLDVTPEKMPLRGSETILVVDDEEELLQLFGMLLAKKGYKPLLAESGKKAVELYKDHQNEIALVVLDLMMPGMDGAEVNRQLKEFDPDVKIIFASGFSEDGVVGNLLKDKNRRFVQKPFESVTLHRTIRELIDGGG